MPYAFIEQVRPGGTVVAPLHRDFWSGALVQLVVGADGGARGRFRGGPRTCRYGPSATESPPRSRDLWADIEAVRREYTAAGSPRHDDFGLTVTAEGQSVWLREPGLIVTALA